MAKEMTLNSGYPMLELHNVTKRFGGLTAVRDVSLVVVKGEIFGIAGPNGAGKSTLFNCIAGSVSFTGTITFEGINMSGLKPYGVCRRGIARTFQTPKVFQTMSVRQNVEVGVRFGCSPQVIRSMGVRGLDLVADALSFTGLDKKAEVQAGSLGLFEKKLLMLAAAMATQPKLLLLDEPMGGLSPIEVAKLKELIERACKLRGITVIIIEHLIKVLVEMCDRLMILNFGSPLTVGIPRDVVNDKAVVDVYLGESDSGDDGAQSREY
ncbi:MAG TPA: ABC transporter ATP-binding protein [Firmicutes bacterium]|nr:ABC transporter ATP-binding protein [Bacillota bacterium]